MDRTGSSAHVGVAELGDPNHHVGRHGSSSVFLRWVIGGAWALVIVAWAKGWGHALGHDHLIEHGPPLWVGLGLFLAGWQVMLAAMMLPSSIPAFRWLDRRTSAGKGQQWLGGAFLVGYIAVWTGFGSLAFLGDIGFHRLVDGWPWLAARPWLIGASVLILAGAFELSPLPGRCVKRSAGPSSGPAEPDRPVSSEAFRLGADHGLGRLSRCWPLMLLSLAVGMASLGWMAALTLMMVVQERSGAGRAARLMGIAFLAMAGLVIVHPGWMPSLFPSSA
jgi:predicted metal-binding membrane protein